MGQSIKVKKPSATLQLFFGVMVLVIGLTVLTGQLWISRFEDEESQLKSSILSSRLESCQRNVGSRCIFLDENKIHQIFDEKSKTSKQIGSLFFPIFMLFVTLGLLFLRYHQQLRFKISRIRARILEALELEFEPRIGSAGEFQPLEDAVLDIFNKQKVLSAKLTKDIQSIENLKVAKAVKEQLIPPTQFGNERVEFFTHYESARGCGGDWWGFVEINQKVLVGIGDATGTGISTAFVVAGVRSSFSMIQRMASENPTFALNPSDLLNLVNRTVFEMSGSKVMMTLFLGVLDLKEKTITYSSAAHNPPWIFRKIGESDFEKISLVAEGIRLGESLQNPAFEEKTSDLFPGDIICLYTDGLLENKNGHSEAFGKKRARAIIEANLLSGPRACLDALVEQIHDHNQGKELDDDVTVVLIQALAQPD